MTVYTPAELATVVELQQLVQVVVQDTVVVEVGALGGGGTTDCDPVGTAAAVLAAHVAAPDPHPQYLTHNSVLDGGNF